MKPEKWPFIPDHITNDGESGLYPDRMNLAKLNGVGIISNRYLRGIQTGMCAALQNPTTIIEFARDGSPVRTDSSLLKFELHPACKEFRRCTSNQYCYASDEQYAELFRGLSRRDLAGEVNRRLLGFGHPPFRLIEAECRYVPETEATRGYLEYDCPLLGYRELLFPIFFQDRVIAVFFVGELCLSGREHLISRQQEAYFRATPAPIGESIDPIKIHLQVRQAHEAWVQLSGSVLGDDEYRAIIATSHAELESLEDTLTDQMRLRRETYVSSSVDELIASFQQLISGSVPNSDACLEQLYTAITATLSAFVTTFDLDFAVLFARTPRHGAPRTLHSVVAHSRQLPPSVADHISEIKFDFGRVRKHLTAHTVNSRDEPDLLKAVRWEESELSPSCNLVRMFKMPFLEHDATALWVGHRSENPVGTDIDMFLETSIQSLYSVILSAMSAAIAASTEAKMTRAYQVLGHESAQLTAGLDGMRMLYLDDPYTFRGISDDKFEDLRGNVSSFLGLLNSLFHSAKVVVTQNLAPKKEMFKPFGTILYKWAEWYADEATRWPFEMVIPEIASLDDETRGPIYGDPELLEQLVYNLVNNATKYCHRGTRIYVDCLSNPPDSPGCSIIRVTDYGLPVTEGDTSIYVFDSQGLNAQCQGGRGIGLYLANQIALAHGGTIGYSSDLISRFNVPLIEAYLSSEWARVYAGLASELRAELRRLKASGDYELLIAVPRKRQERYAPTRYTMRDEIGKETYRVTFTALIPRKAIPL